MVGARWDPGEPGLRRGWGEAGARHVGLYYTSKGFGVLF